MALIWFWAGKMLNRLLKARQISWLALCAAFSFVIMMFNIPIPGGSTGHAVGAALVAILLGPWAAVLTVSITVIIQALLFGDGGVTTIAANSFNMAFVMPFAGYYIYKAINAGAPIGSRRSIIAAGIAGYLSLNVAALFCAVELGIQPLIAHSPDGTPLYCPYSLSVSVPFMAFGHLLIFGFAEAIITSLLLAYIAKLDPDILKA
jgi:cobalt/nickel transport system permease protein